MEIFYKFKIRLQEIMPALPDPSQTLPKGTPGCLKKRRLLNEKELRPELCREYAEKFLALGWWEDALEFFQKAGEAQGLEKIKNHCLETGDAYLLGRLGGGQDPETWRQLAERALDLGKLRFARRAYEQAGDVDKTAMVEGLIAGAETQAED
jgi:tetratricopeptide (TPR) repeat protein